jgi:hypothetical protein
MTPAVLEETKKIEENALSHLVCFALVPCWGVHCLSSALLHQIRSNKELEQALKSDPNDVDFLTALVRYRKQICGCLCCLCEKTKMWLLMLLMAGAEPKPLTIPFHVEQEENAHIITKQKTNIALMEKILKEAGDLKPGSDGPNTTEQQAGQEGLEL